MKKSRLIVLTLVLAEIGKRLDKNIELVQVDSIGRAGRHDPQARRARPVAQI